MAVSSRAFLRVASLAAFLAGAAHSALPFPLPYYASATDTPYAAQTDTARIYGDGAVGYPAPGLKSLLVDASYPKKLVGTRKASVLFIHGGGFTSGGRKDMNFLSRTFTSMGLATFTIDYRMTPDSPQVQPPAYGKNAMTMAMTAGNVDGKAAIRWLHANADSLGLDTSNIFVFGCSAGSIIALSDGVSADSVYVKDSTKSVVRPQNHPGASQRLRGIVSWCGALFGNDLKAVDADDPPIVIYHGTADSTVNYTMALQLKSRCDSVGLECEFHPVTDSGHCPIQGSPDGNLMQVSRSFVLRHIVGPGSSVRPDASRPPSIRVDRGRILVAEPGPADAWIVEPSGRSRDRLAGAASSGGRAIFLLPPSSPGVRLVRVRAGGKETWVRLPPF